MSPSYIFPLGSLYLISKLLSMLSTLFFFCHICANILKYNFPFTFSVGLWKLLFHIEDLNLYKFESVSYVCHDPALLSCLHKLLLKIVYFPSSFLKPLYGGIIEIKIT